MDAEPPARVPPPAADLTWYWLPPGSNLIGCMEYDEDDDALAVGLSALIHPFRTLIRETLLHELTHARRPDIGGRHGSGCGRNSRRWREETLRLASLGAPLL
jgi:hypothetical protein